jgi:hypothetical protein
VTVTGTVNRYARLRSGDHVATVTRVTADSGAVAYLVESTGPYGPVFTPCASWRAALHYAAGAVAGAIHTSTVATWE